MKPTRSSRSLARWCAASTCSALLWNSGAASAPGPPPDKEPIVVVGELPIVVNGRSRRCKPLHEPIDAFPALSTWGTPKQSVVLPNGKGGFVLVPDDEPVTGPEHWQRVGTGIDQYVFRSPPGRGPLCIGSKWPSAQGWGQLRRIVDSSPYTGKRVRFTAWVASSKARLVRFWLAAGAGTSVLYNGGNTNNHPWGGSHGWTPVMLEVGPISPKADHISYGFLLYGGGDVWLYNPKLEVVPDAEAGARKGDVEVVGGSP